MISKFLIRKIIWIFKLVKPHCLVKCGEVGVITVPDTMNPNSSSFLIFIFLTLTNHRHSRDLFQMILQLVYHINVVTVELTSFEKWRRTRLRNQIDFRNYEITSTQTSFNRRFENSSNTGRKVSQSLLIASYFIMTQHKRRLSDRLELVKVDLLYNQNIAKLVTWFAPVIVSS